MSTFLGLLSGGRPPAAYKTYWLHGLGADTTTAKKKAPAKGKAKGKAKTKAKKTAPAAAPKPVRVKVRGGLRNAPLDAHRNPFKRSSVRPGGPAKRTTERSDSWTCDWKAPYRQLCTAVGRTKKDGSPLTKTIKVNRDYKKKYNKAYHEHLKQIGKPKFKNEKHSFYSYRKTDWQSKNPAKGRKKPAAKKTTTRKSRAKKS